MTKPLNGAPPPKVLARTEARLASVVAALTDKLERVDKLEAHYDELRRRGLSNPLDRDDELAYGALIDREMMELARLFRQAVKFGLSIKKFLSEFKPRR